MPPEFDRHFEQVFIVHGNESIRTELRNLAENLPLFAEEGSTVVTAATVEEAREIIQQGPNPDMIILGMKFDGFAQGERFIYELRQKGSPFIDTPIIVLSSSDDEEIEQTCITLGADAYVSTTEGLHGLEKAIQQVIEKRINVNE